MVAISETSHKHYGFFSAGTSGISSVVDTGLSADGAGFDESADGNVGTGAKPAAGISPVDLAGNVMLGALGNGKFTEGLTLSTGEEARLVLYHA